MQLTAQAASSSELYAPVADPAWVTKVINLAKQSINPNKIMIGIPTYGYEYDVTAYAGNQYVYDIMWTFNPLYATQISQQYNVAPTRAPWGEMNLSYFTSAATSSAPLSSNAFLANAAAVAASTYASSTNSHVDFRYLVWPDAQSIAGKIALAKSLGVRGVAIFKLDGGEDPGIWNVLQGVKK
jgi:spore germination protein YaaH